MALPENAQTLLPNALLIVAAIDALNSGFDSCSPKSDDIGAAVGGNSPWVHRHGKYSASLSVNGYVHLDEKGKELARLLRTAVPEKEPPKGCGHCGSARVGGIHHGRQLYACGRVMQWCPPSVPGLEKPEIPARSRKAHHDGVWFKANYCGGHYRGYWQGYPCESSPLQPTVTADLAELTHGAPVSANFGSNASAAYRDAIGQVYAAANGTALVDWPAIPAADGRPGYPEILGDIVDARHLLTPGAPDPSGLSDYQKRLWDAIRREAIPLELNQDGTWGGTFEGRKINTRALEVLIEHRLLEPAPPPAEIGVSGHQLALVRAIRNEEAVLERHGDGSYSALYQGNRIKSGVIENLIAHGLLKALPLPDAEPEAAPAPGLR